MNTAPPQPSRLEELLSWFAAAVLVTGGVVYALNAYENRQKPKPGRYVPDPTPAQEPLTLQGERAEEAGRGRSATAPVHIPWRGWKDIFVRAYQESLNDRILALSGSVVFYSLLALFPALAAGVSSY